MTIKHAHLYPHVNGVPNLSAHGDYALCYKHPDDLHLTPIFDAVSLDFVREYIKTRTWCREAMDAGWEFTCLPSVGINPTGVTIQ
jgi:hypothetical protein